VIDVWLGKPERLMYLDGTSKAEAGAVDRYESAPAANPHPSFKPIEIKALTFIQNRNMIHHLPNNLC
jgi:hypothetical protein